MMEEPETALPYFVTRGIVLYPSDLSLADWPRRAKNAGLTTIGLHDTNSLEVVVQFIDSAAGETFLMECESNGIEVEYELHAMNVLLPRDRFESEPSLFRMNESGERTPDANLCVHSEAAMAIVQENAFAVAARLRPTTGRYFLWGDDGFPGCRCPRCAALSDSDQALLLENRILNSLRAVEPTATLAHLAYAETLSPPSVIRPASGVFLEFAPINRRYDRPFAASDETQSRFLDALDGNLAVLGSDGAQALEYWLDASKFSSWRRPAQKLLLDESIFQEDLDLYGSRGIRRVTSFGAYLDAEYVSQHGDPPVDVYGSRLLGWAPRGNRCR